MHCTWIVVVRHAAGPAPEGQGPKTAQALADEARAGPPGVQDLTALGRAGPNLGPATGTCVLHVAHAASKSRDDLSVDLSTYE